MSEPVNHGDAGSPVYWSIAANRQRIKPHQPFGITLTIINGQSEELSAIWRLHPPLSADCRRPREIAVTGLAPGEARSFSFTYRLTEGGRALFWAWAGEAPLPEKRKSCCVVAEGPGRYSGDTHNHSTWSDGKSTLEQNRRSVLGKGHSFLYSTDHNTLQHAEAVAALSAGDDSLLFCHVPGWEFTSRFGHALAYGCPSVYDPGSIGSHNNPDAWQAFVDYAAAQGGIVYLAHPFEAPRYEFGDRVLYGIKGITGVEVWNGLHHHALHEPNRRAFDAWDDLNSRGDKRYFGNAVSDAHAELRQGDPYIKGWMSGPVLQEVHRLLRTGAFFGSNGPDVQLQIGDAGIGGVFTLDDGADTAVFRLLAFDPLGHLERIVLYRNAIHPGGLPQHRREIAFETCELEGEDKYLYERRLELPVSPRQFYRMEVYSRYGASGEGGGGTGQGAGYAFTNPIWITQ